MQNMRKVVLWGLAALCLMLAACKRNAPQPRPTILLVESIVSDTTGTGRLAAHRGGERFALCSTFKLLLAAQAVREGSRR